MLYCLGVRSPLNCDLFTTACSMWSRLLRLPSLLSLLLTLAAGCNVDDDLAQPPPQQVTDSGGETPDDIGPRDTNRPPQDDMDGLPQDLDQPRDMPPPPQRDQGRQGDADLQTCAVDSDCRSGSCSQGICRLPPTCDDGIKNGDESDVDCGGGCPPCSVNLGCRGAQHCAGSVEPGAWSECRGFSGACDETGVRSRTVRGPSCDDGVCAIADTMETEVCTRTTAGVSCGADETGSWSVCGGFAHTCDTSGVRVRELTSYTCSGGTCGRNVVSESQDCTRATDGEFCVPKCGQSLGKCSGGTCAKQPGKNCLCDSDCPSNHTCSASGWCCQNGLSC